MTLLITEVRGVKLVTAAATVGSRLALVVVICFSILVLQAVILTLHLSTDIALRHWLFCTNTLTHTKGSHTHTNKIHTTMQAGTHTHTQKEK